MHCYLRMLTTITVRCNEFPASKFSAITNYLKTGPLGNSQLILFCVRKYLDSLETKLPVSLGTSY